VVQISWTTPKTWAVGDPGTAADLNTYIRDNSNFLASASGATVATSQTTASLAYADLATAGPAVTVVTGAKAIVTLTAQLQNSGASAAFMAYAISGATTLAAADATALFNNNPNTSIWQASASYMQTGLTPGSNTFTAKYRVTGNTGTFLNRSIIVEPQP
jgi:hypothetical protein